MNWILGIALAVIVGFLLEREIYFYEGVHLGPRLQAWLYDHWSKNYDEGKRLSQQHDEEMLARPLLEAFVEVPEPFILDFATGTGRLSHALLNQAAFQGRIIALDLSQGMLEQAAMKLSRAHANPPVDFVRQSVLPLPFPDATFDAVCALEVLELFPAMDKPLDELIRVLRPGGILLTSRGTEASGRKAKIKSEEEFCALLETRGMIRVQIVRWWKLFDRVIAVKSGSSNPVTSRSLSEILLCSACHASQWSKTRGSWKCQVCGKEISIREGILMN
jgi:ubiquinone/menaquinone biosynthesis C-methylase UbiE